MAHRHAAKRHLALVFSVFFLIVLLSGCAQSATPAANQPIVIGVVNASPARDIVIEGFKAELTQRGFAEGERVTYRYEGALPEAEARNAWAVQLASEGVDLILAVTTPGAQSAAAATKEIPIIFVPVTDPIGAGLLTDLQNPGGNITGVTNGNPHPLRLRLLYDINPAMRRVYVPMNAQSAPVVSSMEGVRQVARELGLELVEVEMAGEEQIRAAIAALPSDIDAIFITPDPQIASFSAEWVAAANALEVPVSSLSAAEVANGVLMSYGEDLNAAAAQSARMAETILNGTPPANLPVETTEYFLSLNLATAQAINLEVPDEVIRRATNIIRP